MLSVLQPSEKFGFGIDATSLLRRGCVSTKVDGASDENATRVEAQGCEVRCAVAKKVEDQI